MEKQTLETLAQAGELYALDCKDKEEIAVSLNPYAKEGVTRLANWQKVDAVNHLISLVEMSAGSRAAEKIGEDMRYYAEPCEDGAFILHSLDEAKWLLYADLVAVRSIESV